MKQVPLLTVAIPTYNRSKTLQKILEQFCNEKNVLFEILVSDDNSSDDTEALVAKYKKRLPLLTYNKNKQNLGYSGNVCMLYELARTRYIWFLCDDDTIVPGGIKKMLALLAEYEPRVAIFNAVWEDSYGRIRVAGVKDTVVFNAKEDIKNYNSLMRITFLSILVVEKSNTIKTLKELDYKDNVFFQLTLSLILLSDRFKFCEFAVPIVQRNVGYKYGDFFKFNLVDHLKAVHIHKHDFDNKEFIKWSKRHLPTALQLYLSQKIGLFTYTGSPSKDTIRKIIHFYKFHSIFILFFLLIYKCTPSFVLKYLYFLQLLKMHNRKEALRIYKKNINRAFSDTRLTGFTNYR